jgi:hypothetical protein
MMRALKPVSWTSGRVAAAKCWNDDFFLASRQRDPALQAEHLLAVGALDVRRALGMRDAAPGGHQIHGAGLDFLNVALAVAVHDAAVEQIGDGGESDMRMRTHVHALAGDELHRAEMIEENEGADHLPLAMAARGGRRSRRRDRGFAAR